MTADYQKNEFAKRAMLRFLFAKTEMGDDAEIERIMDEVAAEGALKKLQGGGGQSAAAARVPFGGWLGKEPERVAQVLTAAIMGVLLSALASVAYASWYYFYRETAETPSQLSDEPVAVPLPAGD